MMRASTGPPPLPSQAARPGPDLLLRELTEALAPADRLQPRHLQYSVV